MSPTGTQTEYLGVRVCIHLHYEKVRALCQRLMKEKPGLPWLSAWSEAEKLLITEREHLNEEEE